MNYFAYGSNLHPARLLARVPSARFRCVVALPGWRLRFHKRGADASAKCNIVATTEPGHVVYGALYELAASDRAVLDAIEGLGSGYGECRLRLPELGEIYFYVAAEAYIDDSLRPFGWYKQLVMEGARYHRLPEDYIAMIDRFEAAMDPDERRHRSNLEVLARWKAQ